MTNEIYKRYVKAAEKMGSITLSAEELKELRPVVKCVECRHRNSSNGWCTVMGRYALDDNWFCAAGQE